MSILISALAIVLVFGVVIFVHEFGHFIVAKKSGVKVDRFSFGLGPEIFGFNWGETRYCVAWIPLGGEVRMAGEAAFEEGDPDKPPQPRDPREFFAKPWYRRIPIVVAGPAMNYVLAFLIFSVMALTWGDPRISPEPVIGEVMAGYPAEEAGLRAGDRVLSLDGKPVAAWTEMAESIHGRSGQAVAVEYKRGEETGTVRLTPRLGPEGRGLIGVTPSTVFDKVGFWTAWARGAQQTWMWTEYTLRYLGEKLVKREKPELSGPLGIATVVAKATRAGVQDMLYLIALISVGIGLFNLFPIPLLDGGHLMFYLWEGITKRPVTRRAMSVANTLGLSLLLTVLVFATYSDIQRMRGGKGGHTETSQPKDAGAAGESPEGPAAP
jgi:regulator of sigma E protease